MKRIRSVLKGRAGASLIAIVIAILFITAIGGIITQITITNIRMKEMETSGKKNFYSAETVVDDMSIGLNNKASLAMKDAYTETLSDYRNIMVTGTNIQENFSLRYMKKLVDLFADPTLSSSVYTIQKPVDPMNPSGDQKVTYEAGKCAFSTVQACLTSINQAKLIPQKDGSGNILPVSYEVDYEKGVFILKDIHMVYDDKGYETNIHTDMVFHTPVLNFKGSNMVKDFMRYSLISDDQILVSGGAQNVVVDGNVYAGVNGITCSTMLGVSDASLPQFIGNTIVTRGDITASKDARWTMGSDTSKVWAKNIIALESSSTTLKGTDYIEDDLSLDGNNSVVKVDGYYYGYNYQKEYETLEALSSDAQYSSAMMLNGRNVKLDLSTTKYLMLAGRTYIKRGSAATPNDIMMGESISARSNQMAYYVPTAFVDTVNNMFTSDGAEKCAKYMGLLKPDNSPNTEVITGNVNPTKNVTPYKYMEKGTEYTVYYLNFASEQCANNFYAAYESGRRHDEVNKYAERYVADDALILAPGLLYALKGNVLYRDSSDLKLKEKKITIGTDNWKQDGAYWSYVKRLAQSYKTLQLGLEQYSLNVPAKVRIYTDESDADPQVNKSAHPLIYNLMNVDNAADTDTKAFTKKVESLTDKEYKDIPAGHPEKCIVLKDGDLNLDTSVVKGGIVICKGNVTVNGNFSGMIMATGKITLLSNSSITSNETLVSQMFSEDMLSTDPKFSDCFYDVNEFTESVIGQVKIEDFLTYDNWTKSKEN